MSIDRPYPILSDDYLRDYFLHCFVKRNHSFNKYFVFHLGQRGFYAEITTVIRAAIYAHLHNLQLVLSNDLFGFRYLDGWADYFEPFCREYTNDMAEDVAQICNACKPGVFMREIIAHRPEKFNFGHTEITGFQNIMDFFMKMLCRPNTTIRREMEDVINILNVPREYAAIHIRRGDKVGWEDIYYPVEIYLHYLDGMGCDEIPVFVMSDDYRAVEEVRYALGTSERKNEVYSLCQPDQKGFNVWDLRRKKHAYQHREEKNLLDKKEFSDHIYNNGRQLLVESLIAARARIFIGTFRSNVSRSVHALHCDPGRCVLLRKGNLERFQNRGN